MPGVITHVGFLDQGGELPDDVVWAFVRDVVDVTRDGPDGLLFGALSGLGFVPSEQLTDAFDADDLDEHRKLFPAWHSIVVDTLLGGVASAMDVECGSGKLTPFSDPTVAFPSLKLKAGVSLPDFVVALSGLPVTLPDVFDVDVDFAADFVEDFPKTFLPPEAKPPQPPFVDIPKLDVVDLPDVRSIVPGLPPLDIQVPTGNVASLLTTPPKLPVQFPMVPPAPAVAFTSCLAATAVPSAFIDIVARPDQVVSKLAQGPVGLLSLVASAVAGTASKCLGVESGTAQSIDATVAVLIDRYVKLLVVLIVGQLLGQGQLVVLTSKAIGLT